MIKVGVNHTGYPVQRNILSLPHKDIEFKKCYDLFKIPEHLYYRVFDRVNQFLLNSYCDANLNLGVDLFHFFNTVSLCSKPWITTFETVVPRIGNRSAPMMEYYVKRLASDSCKSLIAFSDCTLRIQMDFIEKQFPKYADRIREKLIRIYPPQATMRDKLCSSGESDDVHFIIVGHQFFGKGGGGSVGSI